MNTCGVFTAMSGWHRKFQLFILRLEKMETKWTQKQKNDRITAQRKWEGREAERRVHSIEQMEMHEENTGKKYCNYSKKAEIWSYFCREIKLLLTTLCPSEINFCFDINCSEVIFHFWVRLLAMSLIAPSNVLFFQFMLRPKWKSHWKKLCNNFSLAPCWISF